MLTHWSYISFALRHRIDKMSELGQASVMMYWDRLFVVPFSCRGSVVVLRKMWVALLARFCLQQVCINSGGETGNWDGQVAANTHDVVVLAHWYENWERLWKFRWDCLPYLTWGKCILPHLRNMFLMCFVLNTHFCSIGSMQNGKCDFIQFKISKMLWLVIFICQFLE